MRSQKGPLLIRRLSGCTIKACLAPKLLGGKCLQDSLQVLHGHAAPCEKGVQVLHDRFTPCEKVEQVLHGYAAHCERAAQVLHSRFAHCERAVQVLHGHFAHCERAAQVLHSRFAHCERAAQVLHGHFAHCGRAAQVLHTRITHCAGLRRCCTLVSHTAPACARGERRFTPPSEDHSGHCSSSSLTVRPSVGWTIVGAISASGSRTKRRRCISGWGRVSRGVSRQVSA